MFTFFFFVLFSIFLFVGLAPIPIGKLKWEFLDRTSRCLICVIMMVVHAIWSVIVLRNVISLRALGNLTSTYSTSTAECSILYQLVHRTPSAPSPCTPHMQCTDGSIVALGA